MVLLLLYSLVDDEKNTLGLPAILMTMEDVSGRYGASNLLMGTSSGSA
jgi:hypothetical protein